MYWNISVLILTFRYILSVSKVSPRVSLKQSFHRKLKCGGFVGNLSSQKWQLLVHWAPLSSPKIYKLFHFRVQSFKEIPKWHQDSLIALLEKSLSLAHHPHKTMLFCSLFVCLHTKLIPHTLKIQTLQLLVVPFIKCTKKENNNNIHTHTHTYINK